MSLIELGSHWAAPSGRVWGLGDPQIDTVLFHAFVCVIKKLAHFFAPRLLDLRSVKKSYIENPGVRGGGRWRAGECLMEEDAWSVAI